MRLKLLLQDEGDILLDLGISLTHIPIFILDVITQFL
jgi:hypothetical protein